MASKAPKRLTASDRQIGERIKFLRESRGLTQANIGQKLGVSSQQLQKYERGINRISAVRLYAIALLLEVDVNHFLGDVPSFCSAPTDEASNLFAMVCGIPHVGVRGQVLLLIEYLAMKI